MYIYHSKLWECRIHNLVVFDKMKRQLLQYIQLYTINIPDFKAILYIYIYSTMCIYIYIHIYTIYIYIYIFIRTYYVYNIYIHTYIHHIYIYTHIFIRTHTHTYSLKYISNSWQLFVAKGKVAQQLQDASKRLKPRLKRSFSDSAVSKKITFPRAERSWPSWVISWGFHHENMSRHRISVGCDSSPWKIRGLIWQTMDWW